MKWFVPIRLHVFPGFPKLLMICFALTIMALKSYAGFLDVIHHALPLTKEGWKAVPGEDRIYDHETIFDYIDGAGEVYRAYNMKRCLSRRYTNPEGPSIVLDIFDMGSSEDAFGVFTHDQDGEAQDIGQGALSRPGWLSFWKDRFFISIYAEEDTAPAQKAVHELGRVVVALIPDIGSMPKILSKLPARGLVPGSVRYLHHYVVLNYHYYLSDENILNIGPKTDAVLAAYLIQGKRARLLLVMYPDTEKASKALDGFYKHYLPEADVSGLVRLEDGNWSTGVEKGSLLILVLEAETRKLAEDLIREMTESPQ